MHATLQLWQQNNWSIKAFLKAWVRDESISGGFNTAHQTMALQQALEETELQEALGTGPTAQSLTQTCNCSPGRTFLATDLLDDPGPTYYGFSLTWSWTGHQLLLWETALCCNSLTCQMPNVVQRISQFLSYLNPLLHNQTSAIDRQYHL